MASTEGQPRLPIWTTEERSDQTSQSEEQLGYCGQVSWHCKQIAKYQTENKNK